MIDSHAHVNDKRLYPHLDEIVENMSNDGLEYIVNVGNDVETSRVVVDIAKRIKNMYSVVGIHPHDAKTANKSAYYELIELAKYDKILAWGEIGLDYYYDLSPRDVQKQVFKEQLEIADSLKLPVVLHVRDAYKDTYDILNEMKNYLNNGVLLHCYSGSKEMVQVFSEFDAYFSFGGVITFKNSKKEEIIQAVPQDRILIETDCPYLTPEPFRGQTNFPKYVMFVKNKLQSILIDLDVEKLTTDNTKRFYKKIK